MRKYPEQHKTLLIITLILVFFTGIFVFFVIKPSWKEYAKNTAEMKKLTSKLKASSWPNDPERLQALLNEYRRQLDKENGNGCGQIEDTKNILEQSTSMFKEKIDGEYGNKLDFMQKASQTEYKDQFDKLDTYLQGKGISLDTTVFGLNELSTEDENYPLLLKLWTAQALVDCIVNSGLKIVNNRQGGKGRPSPQLKVLQAKSYYLDEKAANPYLLEYPIYAEVTGNIKQLAAFTDMLFQNGNFLPITQLEIVANLPNEKQPRPDADGIQKGGRLTMRIVCSSFFMPADTPQDAPIIEREIAIPKPAGI